jgi:hypothetical protein
VEGQGRLITGQSSARFCCERAGEFQPFSFAQKRDEHFGFRVIPLLLCETAADFVVSLLFAVLLTRYQ